jgi:putative effector of murein hydrolase
MIPLYYVTGVAATVLAYRLGVGTYRAMGTPALLHPVLLAVIIVGLALTVLGVPYQTYFAYAAPVHLLLIPMTVLFAVPLRRQSGHLLSAPSAIAVILVLGSAIAILSSVTPAILAEAGDDIVQTLMVKSITTPIAIGVADKTGGLIALVPVVVISSGIVGACIGPTVCRLAGVTDHRAIGLGLGTASHAIGTARAFQISEVCGAFSTLGLILNALLTTGIVALVGLFT